MTALSTGQYLPGARQRAALMRMDTAAVLKRFSFCEAALVRGMAGWLAALAPLDLKLLLPKHIWEDAQSADALRTRVLELRFPHRLLEVGDDAALVEVFDGARHAPSAAAYLHAVHGVLLPALLDAYRRYLATADALADGPTLRFLEAAVRDKERQIGELGCALGAHLTAGEQALRWAAAIAGRLAALGGVSSGPPPATADRTPLPESVPFSLAQLPARDPHFSVCRFYWPDIVDPSYGYGDGIALQVRSAVSHLNEVWAVETAGAILEALEPELGWEFVVDASRWVYDEARHTQMGLTRLRDWGYATEELPLGTYIYESARDRDPLYRLAMLFYFETKNIGKKTGRARLFAGYGDAASQHDMDFDWADESIHASYGKRWLTELLAKRRLPPETLDAVLARCDSLVQETVASATPDEVGAIRARADALLARARHLAGVQDER